MSKMLPQPTIPGKVKGIIGVDPLILQCGECGEVLPQDRPSVATFVILSGYKFCTRETDGPRRCPECLDAHATECRWCAE